jgi:coenzyme PQQ biosynthesis protein PqqD
MQRVSRRPKLSGRARIKYDRLSGRFLLLSPERGLLLNRTAHEVLELFWNGARSLDQVIGELHDRYPVVSRAELERDVCELVDKLERRALLKFEQ